MNSDTIQLTVIIANYNNAKHLEQCLDSVINQTYDVFEVIVADDVSTDSSREVIRAYESKYGLIRGIYNDKNLGVSPNRHKAIVEAKGNYITTLDSDDFYYDKKKLEKEIDLIKFYKEKENEDVLPFSNVALVNGSGEFIELVMNSRNVKEGMILNEIITRSCPIPRDFIMGKTQYLEAGGYDAFLKTHEDWDLKIRMASKYRFCYTGFPGTAYRSNGMGLSSSSTKIRKKALNYVFNKNLHLVSREFVLKSIVKFKLFLLKWHINNYSKSLKKSLKDMF